MNVLKTLKFQDEANQDSSLFNVISQKNAKDLTRFFWGDLLYRVHSTKVNNFFCIFIWGEQGTAKSGIGQLINQVLFPDTFKINNVAFSNEELRQRMMTLKFGEAVLRDEFQDTFGEGSYQLKATIDNYTRQLRERKNSFTYIQPDFVDMNNFHYYIRTIEFDEDRKEVLAGLQNPMTNAYMGFVRFNLRPVWNNGFWKQYRQKKKKFVEIVASNQYEKIDLSKIALDIMEKKEFVKCLKIKKNGDLTLDMGFVKNLVYKYSPNLTTSQNNMLAQEMKLLAMEIEDELLEKIK